jgi:dihydrofolate reductase
MQISVDGFVSTGPNDDQSWVTWALEDIYDDVLQLLNSIDTILIGRKLAVDYIPHWERTLTTPDDPMYAFAERIVNTKKIVFTKTLNELQGENTFLEKGDFVDAINELKNKPGKDLPAGQAGIVVYGGTSFVSSLIKEKLIDELYLYVNPVALGKGETIFDKLDIKQKLNLKSSKKYNSGINLLVYELDKKDLI